MTLDEHKVTNDLDELRAIVGALEEAARVQEARMEGLARQVERLEQRVADFEQRMQAGQ